MIASSTATLTRLRRSASPNRKPDVVFCDAHTNIDPSIPLEQVEAQTATNGVVAHLEAQVSAEATPSLDEKEESRTPEATKEEEEEEEPDEEQDDEQEEEEESDDV